MPEEKITKKQQAAFDRRSGKGKKKAKAGPEDRRLGNKFWNVRSRHGRYKLFKSPKLLREAAEDYFDWCDTNPLQEVKGFAYEGIISKEDFPRMRIYTMQGLCGYLNCNTHYFAEFKRHPKISKGFSSVIKDIEDRIQGQQLSGAASGLLKENIVARLLGLGDKTQVDAVVIHKDVTGMEIK